MLVLADGTRTSVEDMERFDIGKLHLEGQDFRGAVRWLDGLDVLPARNNRALALFHLQRIDDALEAFMASWQADPENLFALGWATRLRLYRGDDTGARGLCTPLAAATARRLDDALPQFDALLLLRQDELAWEAFERVTTSGWFPHGTGLGDALLRHFGACAASRLGKRRGGPPPLAGGPENQAGCQAGRCQLGLSERAEQRSRRSHRVEVHQALPITWTEALRTRTDDAAPALDAMTASNAYLEALYLGGDEVPAHLDRFVLKHRVGAIRRGCRSDF